MNGTEIFFIELTRVRTEKTPALFNLAKLCSDFIYTAD